MTVGAGMLHEGHLAVGGDQRHGHARGLLGQLHQPGGVDAFVGQSPAHLVTVSVGADRPDHGHLGAQTSQGHGLVVTLAAAVRGEVGGYDHVVGLGSVGHAKDQVHVQRAHDHRPHRHVRPLHAPLILDAGAAEHALAGRPLAQRGSLTKPEAWPGALWPIGVR
ncbi:MAG: hypothetical protein BRC32_06645 [Actinobacteria bacterium QS_8_72_14]|nr:MAG: hypothetical protein BRC32_06645 [Actinobacteria bacterium QS_8_72_14]